MVLNTRFFGSTEVHAFSAYLHEMTTGFFTNRWTDQMWPHMALGMFLRDAYTQFVVDYSYLRCSSNKKPVLPHDPIPAGTKYCFASPSDKNDLNESCLRTGSAFTHGELITKDHDLQVLSDLQNANVKIPLISLLATVEPYLAQDGYRYQCGW